MKDISTFDKQTSVLDHLHVFSGKFSYPDVNRDSLLGLIEFVMRRAEEKSEQEHIALIDNNSIEVNADFFNFCKEHDYQVAIENIDTLSIVNSSGEKSDPFSMFGLCKIYKDGDYFYKSSMIYKNSETSSNISSFCVVPTVSYEFFLNFKKQHNLWSKKKYGFLVQVIGGDNYICNETCTWDDFCLGEKAELKTTVKECIDKFLSSKEYYEKNNVPWNLTLLVKGEDGSGKSTFVNTLATEYDFECMTCAAEELNDMLLYASLKHIETKQNTLFFVEDLDECLEEDVLSVDGVVTSLCDTSVNSGAIIVFTTKDTAKFKETLYNFDYQIDLSKPEYDKCYEIFSLEEKSLDLVKEAVNKHKFTYKLLKKLNKLIVKNIFANSNLTKNNTPQLDIVKGAVAVVTKEHNKNNKELQGKNKQLGLIKKKG